MGDRLHPFLGALLKVGEERGTGRVTVEVAGVRLLSLLVKEGVLLKVSGHLPLIFFVRGSPLLPDLPAFKLHDDAVQAEEEDVRLALKLLDTGWAKRDLWFVIAHQASLGLSTPLPRFPGVKKRVVFHPASLWPEALEDVGAGFYLNRETMSLFQKARNGSFAIKPENQEREAEDTWGEWWADAFD